jgi:hypothetical protein
VDTSQYSLQLNSMGSSLVVTSGCLTDQTRRANHDWLTCRFNNCASLTLQLISKVVRPSIRRSVLLRQSYCCRSTALVMSLQSPHPHILHHSISRSFRCATSSGLDSVRSTVVSIELIRSPLCPDYTALSPTIYPSG